MSSPDLASRIAARNKARVDRLALDLVERGIDAAIEFALEVIEGKGETGSTYRRLVAQAIAELNPDDPVLWQNYDANMLLREHCAVTIEKGEDLSPALLTFAAGGPRVVLSPMSLARTDAVKKLGQTLLEWAAGQICSRAQGATVTKRVLPATYPSRVIQAPTFP